MNLLRPLAGLAIIAAPAGSVTAEPNNPCSALHWNAKFLDMYPRAALACQDVVVKDGVKYAKFKGRVLKVGPDTVEFEVHNVANTAVGSAVWHTTPEQAMDIGGKEGKAKDLKTGDELTFWVAEGQFTMVPKPGARAALAPTK